MMEADSLHLFSTQIVHSLLSSQLNIWIELTKLNTKVLFTHGYTV